MVSNRPYSPVKLMEGREENGRQSVQELAA